MYLYSACNREEGGIGLCGEHIQKLYTVYHPKQKLRRGGGLSQMNTCRQALLQVNF